MPITGREQNVAPGSWLRESHTSLLGTCPACSRPAPADPSSIRYRGDWYHIGCATESERRAARGAGHTSQARSS